MRDQFLIFSDSLTIEVDNEDNSDNADTEPEPLAEPECTYKTNDQMNAESWLLVCSTIGCAAAGISKFDCLLMLSSLTDLILLEDLALF